MVGEALSKYLILEEIGQGGMATVYRGLDTALNREVAVKVLHAHLASREESRERFQREAHAVARLRHDNILEIFDYSGKDSDRNFIVMEFIHGPTLKEFIERVNLVVPELGVMMVCEVCCALAHAHAAGIIHRDIKPENIMIRDDGVIKLTDFGIAAMVDTQKLTVTGQLLGSPAFMAPEMVTGDRLDFRTDVFSLGVLLYRLTVGELPFKGRNPHEVLKRIAEADYIRPDIANPRVGDALSAILVKSLQRDPELRYPSVEALHAALTEHLAGLRLEDTRQALREFFSAPESFQSRLEEQVVQSLLQMGRDELRRGGHARAYSLLNRVLAFDPHHSEVKELLGALGRRRSYLAALRLASLALCILFAGIGVAWGVRELRKDGEQTPPKHGRTQAVALTQNPDASTPESKPDATMLLGSRPDSGPSPGAYDATLPSSRDAEEPRVAVPGHGTMRALPGPRRFVLQVSPPVWTLFVNGKRVSAAPGTPADLDLGPGEHVLTFKDERGLTYPWTFRVGPETQGQVLDHQLKWHPARLEVAGTPSDARWEFLDPAYLARLGSRPLGGPFPIPIRRPGDSGVSAQVRVYRNGYKNVVRQVSLRPNVASRLEIHLPPLQ
ncbi:MAG: protein kinase [Polyangia bacterium]|jgi:serine/threonine-protein kinase|nr:protein kinase [Polyangia bacterium]